MFQIAFCSFLIVVVVPIVRCLILFKLISEDCWNIGCWDKALGCRKRGESPCSAINTPICVLFLFFGFLILYYHIQHNTYRENNFCIRSISGLCHIHYWYLFPWKKKEKAHPFILCINIAQVFLQLHFIHGSIILHLALHLLMSVVFFFLLTTDLNL
jgi:hypothetical protein